MGSNFLFDNGEVPAVEDHKGVPEVEDVGEVPGVGDGEEVPEDGCGSGSRRRDVEEVPEDEFESIVGVVEVVSVFFVSFPLYISLGFMGVKGSLFLVNFTI
jgi:hypothetical protein